MQPVGRRSVQKEHETGATNSEETARNACFPRENYAHLSFQDLNRRKTRPACCYSRNMLSGKRGNHSTYSSYS